MKLSPAQLDALNALVRHDYLISANQGNLAEGICHWSTLNQLRDKGLIEIHYTDAGQRAGWITDEGRKTRDQASAPTRPWPRLLTDTQVKVLDALKEHGSWNAVGDPRWVHQNRSTTERHLDSLVIKGWARRDEDGAYVPVTLEEADGSDA